MLLIFVEIWKDYMINNGCSTVCVNCDRTHWTDAVFMLQCDLMFSVQLQ